MSCPIFFKLEFGGSWGFVYEFTRVLTLLVINCEVADYFETLHSIQKKELQFIGVPKRVQRIEMFCQSDLDKEYKLKN